MICPCHPHRDPPSCRAASSPRTRLLQAAAATLPRCAGHPPMLRRTPVTRNIVIMFDIQQWNRKSKQKEKSMCTAIRSFKTYFEVPGRRHQNLLSVLWYICKLLWKLRTYEHMMGNQHLHSVLWHRGTLFCEARVFVSYMRCFPFICFSISLFLFREWWCWCILLHELFSFGDGVQHEPQRR